MIYRYLQYILSYPNNRLRGSMIAIFNSAKVQSANPQEKKEKRVLICQLYFQMEWMQLHSQI